MSDLSSLFVSIFAAYIGVFPFLIILQLFCVKYKLPKRHQFGLYLYALCICSIIMSSGTPSIYELHFYPSVNLIPFMDIFNNLTVYLQSFLVFVPLGLLLPTLWKQFQPAKTTFFYGFFFSVLIELSQLFNFSTTDINDVLMNTLGVITGYFIFLQLKDLRFMERMCLDVNDELRGNLSKWEVYIYFFTPWLVTFLLTPFILNELWDVIMENFVGAPICFFLPFIS